MPQLHLYVPEDVAARVRQRAGARGQSVSAYLADVVRGAAGGGWPPRFFEQVVGGWLGPRLRRPRQGRHEPREHL